VIDHRIALAISPNAAGEIRLCLCPIATGGLSIQAGKAQGVMVPEIPTGSVLPISIDTDSAEWVAKFFGGRMFLPFMEWLGSAQAITVGEGAPYGAVKWRCVSTALSARYGGTTLTDSGFIYTARVPPGFTTAHTAFNAAFAWPANLTVKGGVTVSQYSLPSGSGQVVAMKDHSVARARDGLMAVSTYNGDGDHEWVDVVDNMVYQDVTTSAPPASGAGVFATLSTDTTKAVGDQLGFTNLGPADQNSPIIVSMTGIDPAAYFHVEAQVCAEYQLGAFSALAKLAKPSPPSDKPALAIVAAANKQLPVSIPIGQANSWTKHAEKAVKLGLDVVGGLGIPGVSTAASGAGWLFDLFT
jgi:hypothetical protein